MVRTYWNSAEAALAKSLLDDCEVSCVLLHEYANSYYPFAMPIRLMVSEDEARRADLILAGQSEDGAEFETSVDTADAAVDRAELLAAANHNPWELLVLAFYLLVPAICLLATKFPAAGTSSRIRYLIARATVTQLLGLIEAVFAILLIAFYFRVRRSPSAPTDDTDIKSSA
ncbi:MAG: DUF2007 domain-containing protein [Verrucomicrobiota bacterium]